MSARKGKSRRPKSYALNQCALYKLKNKRKFASLFGLSLVELDNLLEKNNNYRIFHIGKHADSKPRLVEWPKPHLERLHRRMLSLLQRIETPPYLHSGVKGRSYITNARQHIGLFEVVKLDIKKFYPSTKSLHIYKYFSDEMLCSTDVAGLIAKVLTYNDHIPTGSCVSQQIAFLVHKRMFDEMYALSKHNKIMMTCYVDDVAFSAPDIPAEFLNDIKIIIRRSGLKHHKEKRYTRSQPKLITGVVVTDKGIRVRNKLLMKIHKDFESIEAAVRTGEDISNLDSLLGRINAATEISRDFSGMRRRAEKYRAPRVAGRG